MSDIWEVERRGGFNGWDAEWHRVGLYSSRDLAEAAVADWQRMMTEEFHMLIKGEWSLPLDDVWEFGTWFTLSAKEVWNCRASIRIRAIQVDVPVGVPA